MLVTVCIVLLSVITCVIIALFTRHLYKTASYTGIQNPTVYCLMVTGKDGFRIQLAQHALRNFQAQTHPHKKLIILNHHPTDNVLKGDYTQWPSNVFEFHVNKSIAGNTLGTIRNMSLELVAQDAWWTTWDDDDYRSPTYLHTLIAFAAKQKADCVAFTQRYEYNVNTGFVWQSTKKNGFPHVLARFDRRVQYLDRDTMEDLTLIQQYNNIGKVAFLNNPPDMYIRLVHHTNTSLYVDQNKQSVIHTTTAANYQEFEVSYNIRQKIQQIISNYLLEEQTR